MHSESTITRTRATRLLASAAVMGFFAFAASAQIDGGDVDLSVDAWGRIRAGASDESGTLYPTQRVYTASFDIAPNFTNEPGFDCEPGTFTPGAMLGFNIRAALRVWDDAAENFDAIPQERIQMKLGPLGPVLTPETDANVEGFRIAAGADGKFHHHYGYTLLAPAAAGVYLLELEFASDDGSLATSRPMFLVFNQNADAAEHQRAAAWVQHHYACSSDVNDDRTVDLSDFFDFFNDFDQGLGRADITCDNQVDLEDFFAFFNGFDAGC